MTNQEDVITGLKKLQNEMSQHEFRSYFKYFSDDEKVISGIFNSQKIRFTQPRALNDPLEFNPTIRFKDNHMGYQEYDLNGIRLPSIEFFFRVQLIESQINKYGILSLTKIPDSFDMWSRYSNGHRGFVVEFKEDFSLSHCMKSESGMHYPIKKVEYVDDYSINIEEVVDEKNEIPINILLDKLFFKKTSLWCHENEYRMVRPLKDSPNFKLLESKYPYTDLEVYLFSFDWDCVSSVILGANMTQQNKKLVSRFCRETNIHLSQAHIVRDFPDRFGMPMVYLHGINDDEYLRAILKAPPQLFCTDTIRLGNEQVVTINNVFQLPYYRGYEEVVGEFMRNLES